MTSTTAQFETSEGATTRDLHFLDALNVFLADVRDGVQPYLAIYLRSSCNWSADLIGVAMAVASISTVFVQTPAGLIIDAARDKRLVLTVASVFVAFACFGFALFPTFPAVIFSQLLIGCASAFFAPAVAGITLGLVGPKLFDKRIGRNEAFNHGGNVIAALLIAGISMLAGTKAIFFLVAFLATGAIVSCLSISSRNINYELSRGGDTHAKNESAHPLAISELLKNRAIWIYVISVVLFHFANAALLPQVGQKVSDSHLTNPAVCMSACILVAQFVMIPTAIFSSKLAGKVGRKPVFLVGFLSLPLRALLFSLSVDPLFLISVQILDGIGAGIFGVVSTIMAADLTENTGRFNFTQGMVATSTALGAGCSNLMVGFIAKNAGYNAAFLTLGLIASFGVLFFYICMPETLKSDAHSAAR